MLDHRPGFQSEQQADQKPARVIVISDSFHTLPEAVSLLGRTAHSVHYVHALTRFQDLAESDKAFLRDSAAVICGRIMDIDEEAFSLAPNLKVLALHTSGTDNVSLRAASAAGVAVTNVKGVNANECADLAMGLILTTSRQILRGDRAIRSGSWTAGLAPSRGVNEATLGVIGLGSIGQAVVKRARAFNMNVIANTRTQDAALANEFQISYVSLEELLRESDIVLLTASLTPATRNMIGPREFTMMKKSAYFVNIARGEMVDEQALFEALAHREIAGAGIDVFDTEPLHDSPLFRLDNVVLTPHLAGITQGAMSAAAVRAAQNALSILAGGSSDDTVNPNYRAGEGVRP